MEQIRYFQFLEGARRGEVLVFDKIESDDGMVFICFKDNSRCNEELILPINQEIWRGKHMAEIENPNNIWSFTEEWVGRTEEQTALNEAQERVIVTPFQAGRKKINAKPPRKTNSSFGKITNNIPVSEPVAPEPIKPVVPDNPVYLMVDKSKKFDTDVNLNMVISLPKKSLHDVIDESFENGGSQMIEYIIDSIDIQLIKDALKDSLIQAYNDDARKPIDGDGRDFQVLEEPIIGEPQFASTAEIAEFITEKKTA